MAHDPKSKLGLQIAAPRPGDLVTQQGGALGGGLHKPGLAHPRRSLDEQQPTGTPMESRQQSVDRRELVIALQQPIPAP